MDAGSPHGDSEGKRQEETVGGIPTWGDKLVQDVLRTLLEPYYESRFSDHSHGFRPRKGCHSALREVKRTWKGTVWFIEGDIKGCFDNIDHSVLLDIIRRDIHDGRLTRLIEDLLKAGYMEEWRYYDTLSGTPQGGIISPLLANVYLNELDCFVENTLIPAYTKGAKRRNNPEYNRLSLAIWRARKRDDLQNVERLKRERRLQPVGEPFDPDYRRLRFVRYADDFLLGFTGPKKEAEDIREQLGEFLRLQLKLSLSMEKTLITHAVDEKAKFLGYEVKVTRCNSRVTNGRRTTNGNITLLMPREVVRKIRRQFSSKGKVIHRADLLQDTDYTVVQKYQSVLRGLYNYYCMATNVGRSNRMNRVLWILQVSLAKTLAVKHQCSVSQIHKKYRANIDGHKVLRVVIERLDKKPLVAIFGGIPMVRKPDGLGVVDFRMKAAWFSQASDRSEVVQRLLAEKCELCGRDSPLQGHHIRKLADISRPGRRPRTKAEKIMAARRRKSLFVCDECHQSIHAGKYDGSALKDALESRVQ